MEEDVSHHHALENIAALAKEGAFWGSCALTKEMEAPSVRYGSAPSDGPAEGKAIMPRWDALRRSYYEQMGWDPETGKPLPETLRIAWNWTIWPRTSGDREHA